MWRQIQWHIFDAIAHTVDTVCCGLDHIWMWCQDRLDNLADRGGE